MKVLSSQSKSRVDTTNSATPPCQSLQAGTNRKRGRPRKTGITNQDAGHGLPSLAEAVISNDHTGAGLPSSIDVIPKCQSKGKFSSEVKPCSHSGKRALTRNTSERKTPSSVTVFIEKESGATSDSKEKPLGHSGMKVDASSIKEGGPSAEKQEGKPNRRRKTTDEDVAGKSSVKKVVSSSKFITKSPNEGQNHLEKTQRINSNRKRAPAKKETSGMQAVKDFGENLVGLKVKVWWPLDKMFYEGVIEYFDPVKKKHKVSYVDGDVESLNLKKERWEIVGGHSVAERVEANGPPRPRPFSEMPPLMKVKSEPGSPVMLETTDASLRWEEGTSADKSKGDVTKSGGKGKDDGNVAGNCKDGTPKESTKFEYMSGGQFKITNPKTSTKQMDVEKSGVQIKDDTPYTSTGVKSDTQTGCKPSEVQETMVLATGLVSTTPIENEEKSSKEEQHKVNG